MKSKTFYRRNTKNQTNFKLLPGDVGTPGEGKNSEIEIEREREKKERERERERERENNSTIHRLKKQLYAKLHNLK